MSLIDAGQIGEVRLIRAAFGFPYRGAQDFRYDKTLGGGALLDCGGYPVKLASILLGPNLKVATASLSSARGHEVDIFGSITLENEKNAVAQLSFGMDNAYKCELEIWGSQGTLLAPRIFTPPADFSPEIVVKNKEEQTIKVPADDQFLNSLNHFYRCITYPAARAESYNEIKAQNKIIEDVIKISKRSRKKI
jgi:predicted dehydrogenase